MAHYENDLFLRAARGERTERPPIWLMRQAGRTDPEYKKLKAETGLPLEAMFRHSDLAARISLLPRRIGVDAIIYFQDILTPLAPMGAPFVFRPGPVLETPMHEPRDLDKLHAYDVAEELPFIGEIFRLVRRALNGAMPVLGFAGAPFTLAVFVLEGGSFGGTAPKAMQFFAEHPETTHALLEKLTKVTVEYLKFQIEAGADAVQLFESAAPLLDNSQYREFALPYQQRIFEALRGLVPSIAFARDIDDVRLLDASGADILSLPSSITIAQARDIVGKDRVVQGNLDNRLLADGALSAISEAALACIESGECRGHIFNLNHGLLRRTPFENVCHLVETVKTFYSGN
ncbi:MAG: uroporphyrinogen decarboxylase family protein [Candidatus Hydrogenedentota bacterium]